MMNNNGLMMIYNKKYLILLSVVLGVCHGAWALGSSDALDAPASFQTYPVPSLPSASPTSISPPQAHHDVPEAEQDISWKQWAAAHLSNVASGAMQAIRHEVQEMKDQGVTGYAKKVLTNMAKEAAIDVIASPTTNVAWQAAGAIGGYALSSYEGDLLPAATDIALFLGAVATGLGLIYVVHKGAEILYERHAKGAGEILARSAADAPLRFSDRPDGVNPEIYQEVQAAIAQADHKLFPKKPTSVVVAQRMDVEDDVEDDAYKLPKKPTFVVIAQKTDVET